MRLSLLVVFALALAACSGDGGTGSPGGCEPGATVACTCPDGTPATAICGDDGAPGACACAGELSWAPAILDFGSLSPGVLREKLLQAWTDGGAALAVVGAEVEGHPGFAVESFPAELPGGGAAGSVVVSFGWDRPVRAEGTLVLRTAAGNAEVPLRAQVLGAEIACAPEGLSWHEVPVGSVARDEVRCENVGLGGEGDSGLIELVGVVLAHPELSASWDESRRLFGPGDSFAVEFQYAPVDGEDDAAVARIAFADGGEVEIPLAGTARVLPCDLEASAAAVSGAPGVEVTGEVRLRNPDRTAACLLAGLDLQPDCPSAFRFELPPGEALIGPGEVLDLPFRFQGAELGLHRCGIRAADHHGNAFTAAAEAEVTYRHCLDLRPGEPPEATPSCGAAEGEVELANLCSVELPVDEVLLAEGSSPAFSVGPVAPFVLGPGGTATVPVAFDPEEPGDSFAATLEARLHLEPVSWEVDLQAKAKSDDIRHDRTLQDRQLSPIDILVVIDNGTGMGPEAGRILAELGAAPDRLQAYDYHLAVTTTGVVPEPGGDCPGGAAGGEDGRFFPVDGSRPRVITPDTQDAREVWEQNLRVGTCHTAPARPLEAAVLAVSPPLVDAEDDLRHPEPDDGNAGFLRDGVPLVVIAIGDRDDASPESPEHYRDALIAAKGGQTALLNLVVVAGPVPDGCTGAGGLDAAPAPRLRQFAEVSGAIHYSVCRDPWGLLGLFRELRSCFPVYEEPADWNGDGRVDEGDLLVQVLPDEIPAVGPGGERNWIYFPENQEVCFAPWAVPGAGTLVVIQRLHCPEGSAAVPAHIDGGAPISGPSGSPA